VNDFEALQGLWQVHSSTFEGRPVDESATHYVISGKSMREIVPDLVDDGSLRSTFILDESTAPKRLTLILDYNGPDGPPDPNPIVLRYLYRLDGDTLTLCSDEFGEFPLSICDDYSIMTLVRELLNLKNSTWPDDDGRPITAEEFKARMRLDSITIESDASTTFWHDDGDLFYGHSIQVSIDADDHCSGVDIPG